MQAYRQTSVVRQAYTSGTLRDFFPMHDYEELDALTATWRTGGSSCSVTAQDGCVCVGGARAHESVDVHESVHVWWAGAVSVCRRNVCIPCSARANVPFLHDYFKRAANIAGRCINFNTPSVITGKQLQAHGTAADGRVSASPRHRTTQVGHLFHAQEADARG